MTWKCKKCGAEDYERDTLEKGREYEDFVNTMLCRLGWPNIQYTSEMAQRERGESLLGIEIKISSKATEYQALYIEVGEKSHPSDPEFTPSGIMRKDNTIFWVEGDYKIFYVFQKKKLVDTYASKEYLEPEFGGKDSEPISKTSIGWTLPFKTADRLKLFKVVIENGAPRIVR